MKICRKNTGVMITVGISLRLLCHPGAALAQSDTLSLAEAIQAAREHNVIVRIAQNTVAQSDAHLRELQANRYPSLFFRSHFLYAPARGYNPAITNGGEYAVQFTAGLPLYDGGIPAALVDQGDNSVRKAQLGVAWTKAEIAFSVRSTYFDITRLEVEVQIRQETVRRLDEYITLLRQMLSRGATTESDVLKAHLELNNATVTIDDAMQSLRNAKLLLSNLMGRPPQDSFAVSSSVVPVDQSMAETIPSSNLDLRLIQYDVQAAAFDVTIAKGERLPRFSLNGDLGALGVMPRDVRHETGYSVFLSLEIPIFTWGGIGTRIEQKELMLAQKSLEQDLRKRDLETQWQRTLGNIRRYRNMVDQYSRNVRIAENNYLYAKARFVGGAGSNLEVLDAQRLLLETKLNANDATFQLNTAVANVIRLAGKDE